MFAEMMTSMSSAPVRSLLDKWISRRFLLRCSTWALEKISYVSITFWHIQQRSARTSLTFGALAGGRFIGGRAAGGRLFIGGGGGRDGGVSPRTCMADGSIARGGSGIGTAALGPVGIGRLRTAAALGPVGIGRCGC